MDRAQGLQSPKVFGIGFQKTGTSSLGRALELLGYRVGGYWDFRDLAQDTGLTMERLVERAMVLSTQYDALKDTPWPVMFREMDRAYPGSKFIHIVRDTDSWLKSASLDFGKHPNALHRVIYGCDCPVGNERVWTDRYERHNAEVREYFRGRESDFVSLHMNQGEVGWDPVCRLLGLSVPDVAWPHVNRISTKKRQMFVGRVARKLGVVKDR